MFYSGQQIGSYNLISKLGSGGFGEVWLAEKRSQLVTKKVAVKLPLDEQVDFRAIIQEANLWEQASGHANVLPIIDADIVAGQVLIVSEYAEGGSLADKIKNEGKLSIKQSVEMTIGVLSGLDFLHHKRIIHRDIKPANILLQGDNPRLADFGISRVMTESGQSETIAGTGWYMAPEAFDGKRTVQTDIWAVGVILYELLTGQLPFPQRNPSERMFAIAHKDFQPLPWNIPQNLQNVIAKSLAKQPENRFQTASQMRDSLQQILLSFTSPDNFQTPLSPQFPVGNPSVATIVPNNPKPVFTARNPPQVLNPNPNTQDIFAQTSVQPNKKTNVAIIAAPLLIVGVLIVGLIGLIGLVALMNYQSQPQIASSNTNNFNASNFAANRPAENKPITIATPIDTVNSNEVANASNKPAANATGSPANGSGNAVNKDVAANKSTPLPTPTSTPNLNGIYKIKFGDIKIGRVDSKGFNFEINQSNESGCVAYREGSAKWIKPNVAIYSVIPDKEVYNDTESHLYKKKCVLSFEFYDNNVDISEEESGCEYFHGATCGFGGVFKK